MWPVYRLAAIILVVLCCVLTSSAEVPQNMHVQGRLTDTAGVALDSGFATFTFSIFDADTGGLEIWPGGLGEQQVVYVDSDGLWNARIGALIPVPASLFAADTSHWLQITVERDGELPETLTRIKLSTQPYAYQSAQSHSADSADIATDALALGGLAPSEYAPALHGHAPADIAPQGDSSGLDADLLDGLHSNAFADTVHGHAPAGISPQGDGSGLDADLLDGQHAADFSPVSHPHDGLWSESGPNYYFTGGRVGVGTMSPEQNLHVLKGTTTGTVPNSGSIAVLEADNNGYLSILSPAANESGVMFGSPAGSSAAGVIYNNTLTPGGLQLRTAFNVTGVEIESTGKVIIGGITGTGKLEVVGGPLNSTVVLPNDAISDLEIWNEPGIASTAGAGLATLTSTSMQTLESVTITIPSAGYISVEAKCYGLTHGTLGRNQGHVQIDQTGGGSVIVPYFTTFGLLGHVNTTLANSFPIYAARVYFKSAGSHTFLLEAAQQTGNGVGSVTRVGYPILTATYFSTSYGAVSTVVAAGEAGEFQDAQPVTGESTGDYYRVDLRELERRAASLKDELHQVEAEIKATLQKPESR